MTWSDERTAEWVIQPSVPTSAEVPDPILARLIDLDGWSPIAVHAAALILTLGMAVLDDVTGAGVQSVPFYLAPVLLAAWQLGRSAGLMWAGLAAAAAFVVSVGDGAAPFSTEPWNALAVLATLMVVALLAGALRELWVRGKALARTDPLTGVPNEDTFTERVELERARSVRHNRPFTLAYLDVVGLDALDDASAARSDAVLQRIAGGLRSHTRCTDSVGRLGPAEFGILLPEAGAGAAEVALARIQRRIRESVSAESDRLSIHVGAVICVGAPASVDQLLERAKGVRRGAKGEVGGGVALEVLDDAFGIEAILQRG